MKHKIITIADLRVRLNFLHEVAESFFSSDQNGSDYDVSVSVTQEQIDTYRSLYDKDCADAYIESLELCQNAANELLKFDATCFHGAAFLWRGKAWIFTAPSGTGKTTQYVLWKQLYGEEITMICGDKPFLRLGPDGKLRVYSSPWRGKENMGNDISAELGGIVYLAKSPENTLLRLTPKEAMIPLYTQFLSRKETEEYAEKILEIESVMLQQTPVYFFRNNGTPDSARLCHDTLQKEWKE